MEINPLPKRGAEPYPNFRSISIVAKRLDASRRGRSPPPIFGPCLLWPNGWMDEDATWYRSRPRPTPHCIRQGPRCTRKGHSSPPLFGPCLLWQRSPISATAELFLFLENWKSCMFRVNLCGFNKKHNGLCRLLLVLSTALYIYCTGS